MKTQDSADKYEKAKNLIHIAPIPSKSACLKILGIAMLPTDEAPVKNFAASIQQQCKIKLYKIKMKINKKQTEL